MIHPLFQEILSNWTHDPLANYQKTMDKYFAPKQEYCICENMRDAGRRDWWCPVHGEVSYPHNQCYGPNYEEREYKIKEMNAELKEQRGEDYD